MVCKIFAPHNTRVLYDYSDPRRGYWRTGYNNVNAGNTTTILAHLRICFLLANLWYSYIIFCKDETPQSNIRQCKKTWWRGNPFTRRKRCCGSAETGIWKCRCRKQIGFFSKCSARELRLSNCAIPEPSIITRCQRIHQNPGKVTTSNFQSWRRWARRILRFDALAKRVSHLSPLQEFELKKKNTNWCCLSPKSLFYHPLTKIVSINLKAEKFHAFPPKMVPWSSRLEEWTLSPLKIAPLPRKKKHLSALSYAFEPRNSGCRGRGPRFLCRMYDSEVTVSDAYKLLDQGIKEWIAEENAHLQGNERKGLQKPHTCVEPKMHVSSTIKLYIYISIGIRRATP